MSMAVYPGSFDPITYGHVGIIERLQPLYSEIVVLISDSPQKSYMFSSQERAELARLCLQGIKGVRIEVSEGLTVDYAKQVSADVMIRGIRAVADFEYEMAMANVNKKLCPNVETLIMFASPEHGYISSRMVKEVAMFGGQLDNLVPPPVVEALKDKHKN